MFWTMFWKGWLFLGAASYVTDPYHMFHYDASRLGHRWLAALLCLLFWPFIWLLWFWEWLLGTFVE